MVALLVLAAIGLLYAAVVAGSIARLIRTMPSLRRLRPRDPKTWPLVSVIVPACNEADTLGRAMRSRLGEGYANAEYIVVDDRSTDGTGAIVDQLAREDTRVRAIHVTELPDGWLGKIHALSVGSQHATGDWILFSDADIHHEPGTLARIVAYAEERGIDHVAIFPSIWSGPFTLDVLLTTFLRMAASGARSWKVEDPKSRVAVGGGLFCLVRRAALERAGGLEVVKMEVADDVALAQQLKWTGSRQCVIEGTGFIGLHFYRSAVDMFRGMEKNGFAVTGYSVPRTLAVVAVMLLLEVGPVAIAIADHGLARLLALFAIAILTATQVVVARWLGRRIVPALFPSLGMLLLMGGSIRAMILTLVRGGVVWRGTLYPLARLRKERKFVLFV